MIYRTTTLLVAAAFALGLGWTATKAVAQTLGVGAKDGKPIEIYADEGIEWDQAGRRYVARGKAKAIQGKTTVFGDTLIAYYEEQKGKGSEIYRLDAIGNVKIKSPSETAYGDKGIYDMRKEVLVLTGKNLKLVTSDETVTARDSLEYYESKGLAVARGHAVAQLKNRSKGTGRTVRADVLTTYFSRTGQATRGKKTKGKAGNQLRRMNAFGNVVVSRPGEIAIGERGTYLPDKDTAEIWGNVKITRGQNQLNGDRAIVNFTTGVSRIIANKGARGSPPVRALIVPGK